VPVTIYHNPRCSKSREALALIEARGITPTIVRYLETPPTAKELRGLLDTLGLKPRDLLRTKEAEYKALGLGDAGRSDAAILDAIASHPVLLERPIVVNGRRAVIARPPERALEVL